MNKTSLLILAILTFMVCGCAIEQELYFFPSCTVESTTQGWKPVRDYSGGCTAFILRKADSSTREQFGYVEFETLVIQLRSLEEDKTYYLPGDAMVEYSLRRGDKVDGTRSIEGEIYVHSVGESRIILFLDLEAVVFDGEHHRFSGSYIYKRHDNF